MQLPLPFIQLPLLFDADRLAAEVAALGEDCWMPHPQGFPGNSMLPLIAVGGDPGNESFAGAMRPVPLLARCPYLTQVLASLGVTLGRTRLMRLAGHAEVTRHADMGYYWADRVRVHVPIVTQPTVRFECGGLVVNMAAGECWIFDTWRQHRVLNDAERSRIHLVVDTVGGERFWSLSAAGRDHAGQPLGAAWQPQQVPPAAGPPPALLLETRNLPSVMSPWELNARVGFLLAEAEPHPNLVPLQAAATRLVRTWQALWAAHGDGGEGREAYRAALDEFMAVVRQHAPGLVLRNQLLLLASLQAQIGKVALGAPVAAPAAAPRAAPLGPAAGVATAAPLAAFSVTTASFPAGFASVGVPPRAAAGGTPVAPPRGVAEQAPAGDPLFARPLFIVSAPRSGSTLLFETLAGAPGLYTIGGESHALIESLPELSPASNGLGSNRLTAAEAREDVARRLRERFRAALRDRDGRPPPAGPVRLLEKTPKNALRVPFLARVFPEARFLFLHRDPREVMGSMIDAWNSGRFRTYPGLPGWAGPDWSLLLVPGWQALAGRPVPEIVAAQWEATLGILLDDLAALPAERVLSTRYDRLLADPAAEVARLCQAAGLGWDRPLDGPLPPARYTLSAPAPEKWRRHAAALEPLLARVAPLVQRAEQRAGPAAATAPAVA